MVWYRCPEPFSDSDCLADVVLRKSWMIFSSLPCISTSVEAKMLSIKPDVASSVMRVGYARNRNPFARLRNTSYGTEVTYLDIAKVGAESNCHGPHRADGGMCGRCGGKCIPEVKLI